MSARYISLVPKRKRMRVDNFVNLSPCLRISVDSSVWKKKKEKVKVLVTQLCPTLWVSTQSVGTQRVGHNLATKPPPPASHSLLQGIFLSQDWTSVSCVAGRFFIVWATKEDSHLMYSLAKYTITTWNYFSKNLSISSLITIAIKQYTHTCTYILIKW